MAYGVLFAYAPKLMTRPSSGLDKVWASQLASCKLQHVRQRRVRADVYALTRKGKTATRPLAALLLRTLWSPANILKLSGWCLCSQPQVASARLSTPMQVLATRQARNNAVQATMLIAGFNPEATVMLHLKQHNELQMLA